MYHPSEVEQWKFDTGLYGVDYWKKFFTDKGWHLALSIREREMADPTESRHRSEAKKKAMGTGEYR